MFYWLDDSFVFLSFHKRRTERRKKNGVCGEEIQAVGSAGFLLAVSFRFKPF